MMQIKPLSLILPILSLPIDSLYFTEGSFDFEGDYTITFHWSNTIQAKVGLYSQV